MPHIYLDFDGVLHSFSSPWQGPTVIPDPPVDGAIDFLHELHDAGCRVGIFSTRNLEPGGVVAIKQWLFDHGLENDVLESLDFPTSKSPFGTLFIDDRAFHFEGTFPSVEFCKTFKPWNKQ